MQKTTKLKPKCGHFYEGFEVVTRLKIENLNKFATAECYERNCGEN